jgi:hypothetical protein
VRREVDVPSRLSREAPQARPPANLKGSCSGGEINRFGEETLNRRGVAELSTLSMWQETAAMRDVNPAYVGSGFISLGGESGPGGSLMSAVPPIASKFCAPQ